MAQINYEIAPRAHELIRDQIGLILADELLQQAAITYDDLFLARVFVQRSKPIQPEECPLVVVSVERGDLDNHTVIDSDGEFTFFIDVFTIGSADDNNRGDIVSSFEAQRLAGACQAILLNPVYVRLGFAPPFIMRSKVVSFEPGTIERGESTNLSVVRITLRVKAGQTEPASDQISTFVTQTQVFLSETDEGYLYSGEGTPIPPPACNPVTYEITDTNDNVLYSGSIPSGGELNQEIQDSTAVLKDTDGNILSTTSILAEGSEDIVAPDAVVNFTYEDGTPLQTFNFPSGSTTTDFLDNAEAENSDGSYTASEKYGTIIQLPDITVTDSNGSTYTQPSVTDVFCTPCEDVDLYVGEANVGSFPSGSDVFVKVIQDGLEVIPEDVTVVDDEVNIVLADTVPCADTNLEVIGFPVGSVGAGSTVDVQLSDSGGTVTPDSVTLVGTDLQIVLPDAVTPTPVGATLMKTGQTTSYRTGDDGDIEAGRLTNFLTLDSSPLHNDGTPTINTTTNRFTDILGGQTYANNIVLDWSTWDGSTLLGYDRTDRSGLSTNDSIDACLLLSVGGFTGYRLVNFNELCNLWNKGRTSVINYPPFNHSTGFRRYLSSTTVPSATSTVYILQQAGVTPTTHGKTSGSAFDIHIAVRTFSLSTSNVLS